MTKRGEKHGVKEREKISRYYIRNSSYSFLEVGDGEADGGMNKKITTGPTGAPYLMVGGDGTSVM